jgi:hypothetical protein
VTFPSAFSASAAALDGVSVTTGAATGALDGACAITTGSPPPGRALSSLHASSVAATTTSAPAPAIRCVPRIFDMTDSSF